MHNFYQLLIEFLTVLVMLNFLRKIVKSKGSNLMSQENQISIKLVILTTLLLSGLGVLDHITNGSMNSLSSAALNTPGDMASFMLLNL